MKCPNCGNEVAQGASFCNNCGAFIPNQNQVTEQSVQAQQSQYQQPQYQQQTYQQQPYQQQQYQQATYQQPLPPQVEAGFEYKPISAWGYLGYELLFSIPCVGFILLIVFSFGGTKNINLRNFARSYFCLLIILAILLAIFYFTIGAAIGLALR